MSAIYTVLPNIWHTHISWHMKCHKWMNIWSNAMLENNEKNVNVYMSWALSGFCGTCSQSRLWRVRKPWRNTFSLLKEELEKEQNPIWDRLAIVENNERREEMRLLYPYALSAEWSSELHLSSCVSCSYPGHIVASLFFGQHIRHPNNSKSCCSLDLLIGDLRAKKLPSKLHKTS